MQSLTQGVIKNKDDACQPVAGAEGPGSGLISLFVSSKLFFNSATLARYFLYRWPVRSNKNLYLNTFLSSVPKCAVCIQTINSRKNKLSPNMLKLHIPAFRRFCVPAVGNTNLGLCLK